MAACELAPYHIRCNAIAPGELRIFLSALFNKYWPELLPCLVDWRLELQGIDIG